MKSFRFEVEGEASFIIFELVDAHVFECEFCVADFIEEGESVELQFGFHGFGLNLVTE